MADANARDTQIHKQSSKDEIIVPNVHWGYLNGWRILRDGKRVKTESWQTYWVDLSGPTLRLYRDTSLPQDSAKSAPPLSTDAPTEENIQRAAFFSLKGGSVEILSEEELHPKKAKQSDLMRVYRRHLFRITFPKINTAYVFQAPSRSSLLRWVSKAQEGIDQSDSIKAAADADEQLRKVKSLLKKSRSHEDVSMKKSVEFGSAETLLRERKLTAEQYHKVKELKTLLQKKKMLLEQLEKQESDFLGEKDGLEITGEPFEGTLALDYCLIPGRVETYIPKGAKISVEGQLPNRRWRCHIDKCHVENLDIHQRLQNRQIDTRFPLGKRQSIDHTSNNTLSIDRTDSNASTYSRLRTDSDVSSASKVTTSSEISISDTLSSTPAYDGSYPLIGCLPTSAIEELLPMDVEPANQKADEITKEPAHDSNDSFMSIGTPPSSPPLSGEESLITPPEEEFTPSPYSPHKRNLSSASRKTFNQHVISPSQTMNGRTVSQNINSSKGGTLTASKEGFNPFQNLPNRLTLSKVDKRGMIESLSSDEETDVCELSDDGVLWPNRGGSIRQKIQERTQSFRKDIEKLGIQGRCSTMAPRLKQYDLEKKGKSKDTFDLRRNRNTPRVSESLFISDKEGLFKNPVSRSTESLNEKDDVRKTLEEFGVTLRPNNDGFVIRGKLRQKGLSIVIGDSSSSEEEEEASDNKVNGTKRQDNNGKIPNGKDEVFQKILKHPSEKTIMEDHNSNELPPVADIDESLSDLTLSSLTSSEDGVGRVTSGLDLISEFSQNDVEELNELEIERPRSIGTSFGFELPPPKNTRRKLKLCKQQPKGFGFRLTTYRFLKEDGLTENSNFVSYVEDEGPAYIAGLRPGDIILEVDDKPVDEIDHKELTKLISECETEMIVVVKYTNEGKRNELLVEVGNRQAKLRQMMAEYDRICQMEKSVKKDGPHSPIGNGNSSSPDLSLEVDDVTKEYLNELKSLYKEVVIWTSKFQRSSSEVLHSIQETLFDGQTMKSRRGQTIGLNSTTSSDLLYIYSSAAGLYDGDSRSLSADLNENIGVPLKNCSSLDGFGSRQASRTLSLDDRSLAGSRNRPSANSLGERLSNHVQLRQEKITSPRTLDRSKRHQSYKLAVDPSSFDLQAQEANIDYI